MKKLSLSLLLLALVLPAQSQTLADAVAAAHQTYKDNVCNREGLDDGCLDADVLTAWCVSHSVSPCTDGRLPAEKHFGSDLLFARAQQAQVTAAKMDRLKAARIEAINAAIATKGPAALLTICQAIPGAVCR